MFTTEQLNQLKAPLVASNVSVRNQAGRDLSYIEGWHAINEANRIFGFDAWDHEIIETAVIQQEEKTTAQGKTLLYVGYRARVKVTVTEGMQSVTREDVGFGQGQDADLGRAHESAVKEAVTDAMKRALRTFGNQFGLALYDKSHANVCEAPKVEDPVKVAGAWMKDLGYGKDDFQAFKAGLKGFQLGWVEVCMAAITEGVESKEDLMLFVAGLKPKTKQEASIAAQAPVNA